MPRGVPNSRTAKATSKVATEVGEVPATATSGQTQDTTEDNIQPVVPSAAVNDNPGASLYDTNVAQLRALHNFLITRYPEEFNRSNRQHPETAVDIAMRLLSGTSMSQVKNCPAQYCNFPANHQGDHGWVVAHRN